MALKFALLSLALLGYFSVSVNAVACTLEYFPVLPQTHNLEDIHPVGEIIGFFKIIGATPQETPNLPTFTDPDDAAAFTLDFVELTATTRAIALQIGEGFKNLVATRGEVEFSPKFTLTCTGNDGGTPSLDAGFKIKITDTNNNAPTFDANVKNFEVDNTKWKKEEKLNKDPFKLFDADINLEQNTLTVDAKFVDAGITQKFKKIEVSKREDANAAANFDLFLEEKVVSGNHSVILTASDGKEGHQIKKTIEITFTGGAMQMAGAFVMVTLFSIISTFISN